ncbi:MAG: hypothetical protein COX62_00505 [Deltaproteobacteria bacterium CG_4_10_14_0_2_um_filter_43_8]|nr:MAG: hypothetical protein COV43_00280 [Deltaproteobacteria bacterium CG11_big_fil_rev_8_21_14_0_20_42_23]PJA22189.1 MAG: hypothetical protein COX62_00505 [Deltaproteobacteria bacterium CG_4_10_14_0_2_um_filter_43_8]PJC64455.1 MAG: hypothetical protein CO021_04185 [Deltaproteobacteria bacterium CG_4_9_14_0_2_um_filter_42_21]
MKSYKKSFFGFRSLSFLLLFLGVFYALLFPLKGNASKTSSHALFFNTAKAIELHYVDSDRVKAEHMLEKSLEKLELYIPEVLVKTNGKSLDVNVGMAKKSFSKSEAIKDLSHLAKVLDDIYLFVAVNYDGKLEKSDILYVMLNGMLEPLDPHSSFLTPKIFKEFRVGTKGEFGGLGFVIGIRDGNLTVISPLEGSPAFRAGIKSGDSIHEIDGVSTINMSLTDAVNRLRGRIGSKVSLLLMRKNKAQTFAKILKRELIKIDSIQSSLLSVQDKDIGYIKVKSFQENTTHDLKLALKDFQKKSTHFEGLILDLRNNPGGLLQQAIEMCDLFLSSGTIVSTVAARGKLLEENQAQAVGTEPPYPLVVIVNEGSASAAEIVSGALKANNRAVVVGERTFGKGSVQTVFNFGEDEALKLTIAQYLAAGTLPIQLRGLIPDIELVPTIISKKNMNLVKDEFFGEESLDQHLEEKNDALEKPLYTIPMITKDEDLDEEELSEKAYSNKINLDDDFAATFSRDFLLRAGAFVRPKSLVNAKPFIQETLQKNTAEIAKKLAELDIDWSQKKNGAEKTSTLNIITSYELLQNEKKVASLTGGEKATLKLSLTNKGKTPLYRFIALGSSEHGLLNNREFVFGKINPSETKSQSVSIDIPDGVPAQELPMTLSFQSDHTEMKTEKEKMLLIPIRSKDTPEFGISFNFKEEGQKNLGNKKPLHLEVSVENTGKGNSGKDTIATLSNESGDSVFLKKGRAVLGTLKPKESKTVDFVFYLEPEFTEKDVQLDFLLYDSEHVVALEKTISLHLANGHLSPAPGQQLRGPQIFLSQKNTDSKNVGAKWQLEGVIKDDKNIKDYFVFVQEKKMAYFPAEKLTKELPFSLSLPLEKGNNKITIGARDYDDLVSRETIVIRRSDS